MNYYLIAALTDITKSNVFKSLEIMWKGLLAIFIVIGIIAIATFIMNDIAANRKNGSSVFAKLKAKLTKKEPEKEEEKE